MSKGMINFQIEAFKNIEDEDRTNNFVDVFPSNCMNRSIGKYPLIIANTDSSREAWFKAFHCPGWSESYWKNLVWDWTNDKEW